MGAKWSNTSYYAQASTSDINASTSYLMGVGATSTSNFAISFGTLRDWLATAATGFPSIAVTVLALRGPSNIIKFGTDATGTNSAATSQTFTPPISTGTGTSAGFIFQAPTLGSTGTTPQTMSNFVFIGGNTATGATFIGRMIVGATALPSYALAADGNYLCTVADGVNGAAMGAFVAIDSAGTAGGFVSRKARGTNASPTAVLNGDTLAGFFAAGYDGTSVVGNTGAMRFVATEGFATGSPAAHGTGIDFAVTPNGTSTRVVSAMLDGSVTAGDTRLQLWTVDTGGMQRVRTITNASITTLLGSAGRLLYVPA